MRKGLKILFVVIAISQNLWGQRDSLNSYYSDTSYTYSVIRKMLKTYNNVNGTLCYQMHIKQYDSSQSVLLDSSFSTICYSGKNVRMEQKDDIIITLDTMIFYINHIQKLAFYRSKPKGKKDYEYSNNPMAFLLNYYKERKLRMRKLNENNNTYTYSVDFDFQKDMYIVTADKQTDYIRNVRINYFVPDESNLVSTRILNIDYLDYKFSNKKEGINLSQFITIEKSGEPKLTNQYKDYKLNLYEN